MTTSRILVFATLVLVICSFTLHQTLIVRPGKGVGTILLHKTTLKEIRKQFGKQKFTSHLWLAPRCGQHIPYKVLDYQKQGIIFQFHVANPHDTDKVTLIEFYGKCDVKTDKDIALNISKRIDVYRTYGTPVHTEDTLLRYEYPDMGIAFEFSTGFKSMQTDTLKRIYIFEPIKRN